MNRPGVTVAARAAAKEVERLLTSGSYAFTSSTISPTDTQPGKSGTYAGQFRPQPRQPDPARPELLNLIAEDAISCAPASSPSNWRTRMRIPMILAIVALVLSGCNANQAINPSGQAGRCANDPSCNPYNPSSYAQNNVGIGR
jgi:hypothetical protein